uniref:Uncharacterized protein n=1 Tax=blood disease bacterium R229 TaxID=741978 RepID=G2ZLL3_9RALS|nr:conserved hypothetical protein [blood disease bacterium R229]
MAALELPSAASKWSNATAMPQQEMMGNQTQEAVTKK